MKKISELIIHILLMAVIDGLLIYTEFASAKSPFAGDGRKVFLIAVGNLLCILVILFGEKISNIWHTHKISKAADIILLIMSAPVMLVFVQMITWLSGKRTKSMGYLGNILKRVFSMSLTDMIGNMVICYILLLILILIFRKVKTASVIFCYILVIFALVNFFVMEFRGEAFFLFDIMGINTAAEVVGGYEFKMPLMLGIPLIYSIVFTEIISKFQRLELGKKSKKNLLVRLSVLTAFIVGMAVGFKPLIMKMDHVLLWSVNQEYRQRGLIYGFAREFRYIFVEEPEGYSAEAVEKIAEQIKSEPETEQKATEVQPENIIMIMNESLADFESVADLKTDSEILPYIRSMDENVKHGNLHVPTYGGGTAKSEYEALTGNSISFLPSGSVPYELYVRDPEYGMADILKSQGYYTIAMHPNHAHNWNRDQVYPEMGFDEFISLSNWGDQYTDKVRTFISDQSAYDKIISLCEEKEKGQKLFTFCVTMQNHGGYRDSKLNGFKPDVKLNYDTDYPYAETYLSLERESDKAFRNLIEYFKNVDEPTMIVMFGDHWPKLEAGFISELLGKDKDSLDLIESQVTYTTPYVIWTNYASETVKEDISANYLGSYVLQLAGAKLTPYNQFLLKLKEQLPIIGIGAVCDKDGNWYVNDEAREQYKKLLGDYNILEYNNQFEKKNVLESLFTLH